MENENISITDFEEAFEGNDDYQTGGAEDVAAEEVDSPETAQEETMADEGNDAEEAEDPADGEKTGTEDAGKEQRDSETFTLKVNKEEKTYSREEVISLAQKGADYDRVKEQLSQSRQTAEELQGKLDDQKAAMDILAELAKDSKVEIPMLLRNMQLGLLMKQGFSEEAANERLLRMEAEKENAALKAAAAEVQSKETSAQRAQRETAEFRSSYPEVELTKELLDTLMVDVQGGMSLIKAYQKHENAQKDAQIAELQRQLAAEKQNKANLAASPGSQKDSGGKRSKSDYDDFLEAFN